MMNEWIISSSVLIAAVLLGRFLLRGRISLRLQYGLWALVLIRLLMPVQIFTSNFGTGSIAREVDISAPVRQVYVSANEDRYEREYDEAYQKVVAEYTAQSRPITQDTIEKEAYTMVREAQKVDLDQLLLHIWFAGMVVAASVIVSCNVHLSIQLKRRRWELEVADSLLPVYVTEAVPTPCVFGLFRPAIYLTPDAVKNEQMCAHVLAHELTHYRHWDHVWSVLRSLCLVLHWYNPLVWIAAKVSRADAELACDEGALARLGESERGDYGRTLVSLTCSAPVTDLLLTATTMTGSAGSLRERIRLLMKRPRNTVLTVTAVILLVTLTVGCTFSGAPATTQIPETIGPNEVEHLIQTDLAYALPMDRAMAAHADQNPRVLTAEEVEQVRETFASTVYDAEKDEYFTTAVSAFFTSYYDDVTELDLAEFLRYFPTSGEATEEEFQLLRQKYGADFDWAEHESLQDMPVPVHRYAASDIDAVTRKYANLPFQELQNKESVYYLEESDSYYNFTSDFGPGMFSCTKGFVYDGGAILYSHYSALFLTEAAGHYSIKAHLPVIDKHGERSVTEADSFTADGLLVYPGTWWGMTERELLNELNIQEYGIFSGMRGIHLPTTTFCGYPASIAFYFDHYRNEDEWGLSSVRVQLTGDDAADAVNNILYEKLGRFDFQTSGVACTVWWSDLKLEDMISAEAYAVYQEQNEAYPADGGSASSISWYGAGYPKEENVIYFSSGLHRARQMEAALTDDQTDEVRALFAPGGDPWYLAALAAPYADYRSFDAEVFFSAGQSAVALTDAEKTVITDAYGKEALSHTIFRMSTQRVYQVLETYVGVDSAVLNGTSFLFCPSTDSYLLVKENVPQLRVPEILFCERLDENQICMIYRFLGEEQRYCATLLKGENWKVYSNHLVLEKPQDAHPLTADEAASTRLAFAPDYYDAAKGESVKNPRAAFLLDMYEDVSQMSRSKFLSYYPGGEICEDEAEFQLLKKKYPEFFETEQTISDMNWPIHRIPASEVKAVMEEYTLVNWDDLPYDGWYHYLEETDCYYTYYSDVGLFGFHCTGGWVYDGGAMLYNDFTAPSVLILTEQNGKYYIQAHLPAIVAE